MRPFLAITLLILLTACTTHSHQQTHAKAPSFASVEKLIDNTLKQYPAEHVLLVFDMDDTLLTMPEDFGGVAWFDWQANLLKEEGSESEQVATTFPDLLQVQAAIFAENNMELMSPLIPAYLKELEHAGMSIIIATARGPEMKKVSQKQLRANNFQLNKELLFAQTALKLNTAVMQPCANLNRPIDYDQGVFYLGGQNKGEALDCLLEQTSTDIQAVIFVDDQKKNTAQVCDSLLDNHLDSLCIQYSQKEKSQVDFRTNTNRQKQAVQAWYRFDAHEHVHL